MYQSIPGKLKKIAGEMSLKTMIGAGEPASVTPSKRVLYYGIFFDQAEGKKLLDPSKAGQPLARIIPDPHVTFKFQPSQQEYPPAEMLGQNFPVRVVGVGNNGSNHGYLVEIPQELEALYKNPAPKHITLSISQTGKAVDTKNLDFKPITPFTVIGKMGYNDGSRTFFTY